MDKTIKFCECCIKEFDNMCNNISDLDNILFCDLRKNNHEEIFIDTPYFEPKDNINIVKTTKNDKSYCVIKICFKQFDDTINKFKSVDDFLDAKSNDRYKIKPTLDKQLTHKFYIGSVTINNKLLVTEYSLTNENNIREKIARVSFDNFTDYFKNKKISLSIRLIDIVLKNNKMTSSYCISKICSSNLMPNNNILQFKHIFSNNLLQYVFPQYIPLKDLYNLSKTGINKNTMQVIHNIVVSKLTNELKAMMDGYDKFVDALSKSNGHITGSFITLTILGQTKSGLIDKYLEELNIIKRERTHEYDCTDTEEDMLNENYFNNTYDDINIYFKNETDFDVFREIVGEINDMKPRKVYHEQQNVKTYKCVSNGQKIKCEILNNIDVWEYIMTNSDLNILHNTLCFQNNKPVIRIANLGNILNKYFKLNPTSVDNNGLCLDIFIKKYVKKGFKCDIISCLNIMHNDYFSCHYTKNNDNNIHDKNNNNYVFYHKMQNNKQQLVDVSSFKVTCSECSLTCAGIKHYHTDNCSNLICDDREQTGEIIHIIHVKDLNKYDNLPASISDKLVEKCCDIIELPINTMSHIKSLNILKKIDL